MLRMKRARERQKKHDHSKLGRRADFAQITGGNDGRRIHQTVFAVCSKLARI
jgi:hypothetical protein